MTANIHRDDRSGDSSLHLLNTVFGHAAFRGAQSQIVAHVTAGGDALVLMPTGGGKSLCYQLPALLREGTALVVSPLIALMQDQVAALRQLGVRAAFLNSTLDAGEVRETERALCAGELDLIYVAPERLVMPRMLDALENTQLALFAIDEAHCVSQWGHDFRPEYLQLSLLHERFPEVPRIALTATADPQTRAEIILRLALDEARVFIASFDRPNIRYTIVDKEEPRAQLLRFIREEHASEAGIVYCLSRKKVDETAAWLASQGVRALPYHAGMDAEARAEHQARFQREEDLTIVATIAFGMGIDKPDVRFVAHLDLPKSIEAYYQETGRAGRDGAPADAWMAYGLGDVVQLRRMIEQSEGNEEFRRISFTKLDALLGLCETAGCRRVRLLDYFGEYLDGKPGTPCGNCDNCLAPPQTWDATDAARKALSCIYRTGQRFGAVHLIDVLAGRATERVSQWGHDKLPIFGIGADLDERTWRSVFRQLVALGYARPDHESFGALRLTESSRAVLKGGQSVEMRRASPAQARKGKAAAAKARRRGAWQDPQSDANPDAWLGGNAGAQRHGNSGARLDGSAGVPEADEHLLARLKAWRTGQAREQSVPAYVIFHDSTLAAIAAAQPRNLDALSGIAGIGAKKLERYGPALLEVLRG